LGCFGRTGTFGNKISKHIWAGDIIQGEAETTGMNFQLNQMSVKERFERLQKLSAKSIEIILFIQKHTKNIYDGPTPWLYYKIIEINIIFKYASTFFPGSVIP